MHHRQPCATEEGERRVEEAETERAERKPSGVERAVSTWPIRSESACQSVDAGAVSVRSLAYQAVSPVECREIVVKSDERSSRAQPGSILDQRAEFADQFA